MKIVILNDLTAPKSRGAYFKAWRRKIGVVTLVMACVFMAGWVRSYQVFDHIGNWTDDRTYIVLGSFQASLALARVRHDDSWKQPRTFRGKDLKFVRDIEELHRFISGEAPSSMSFYLKTQDPEFDDLKWDYHRFGYGRGSATTWGVRTVVWTMPYWPLIAIMTLLSAWLLLSKPRQSKKPEPAPTTGEPHA